MSESLSLGTAGAATRDRAHTLFGQTMDLLPQQLKRAVQRSESVTGMAEFAPGESKDLGRLY